jgi:REP element-mobilizing transposase RayT
LEGPGVPHTTRPEFAARYPLHVTLRVRPGVGHLRAQRQARVILVSLRACQEQFGVRVVHFSIQGTHLHLLLEAQGARALSRAMQSISMRIAKGLNACVQRRGAVFVDRYHAVILRNPRQVANARRYVLENHRHHTREWLPDHWRDPLSTARALLASPATWLLREGWRLAVPDR